MADFLLFDALCETVRSLLSREKPVNYLSANNLRELFFFLAQPKRLSVCTFDYWQTSPRHHSPQLREKHNVFTQSLQGTMSPSVFPSVLHLL